MAERYSDLWLAKPLWHVVLSDGRTITENYHDITWIDLHVIIEQEKVSIVSLYLSFRDREIRPLPENALGYFCGKCCLFAYPVMVKEEYYMLGYLKSDETVHVEFWKIPEVLFHDSEIRQANDAEKVGKFLIRNPIDEDSNRLVKEEA